MRRLGPRHLDRRRRLLPRDYLATPDLFGQVLEDDTVIPSGGNAVSHQVALLQHALVARWRATRTPTTASICRRFGFSKQTWSRICLGQRWAGETGFAALTYAALQRIGRHESPKTAADGGAYRPAAREQPS